MIFIVVDFWMEEERGKIVLGFSTLLSVSSCVAFWVSCFSVQS